MFDKDFIFRAAETEQDAAAVKTLESECGLEPWRLKDYWEEIENGNRFFRVLEFKERIIGFILARLIMYQNPHDQEFELNIYNIGINKEFRRQGLGTIIFSEIEKKLGDSLPCKIFVEVRESNHSAISLYLKNGLEPTGKRKNFYENPIENALIMCKAIYFLR